jgi:hypothetical protein
VPLEFLDDCEFLVIPKSWDSKIGKETLEVMREIERGVFLSGRNWKDLDWTRKKFPAFSWGWLSKIITAAIKDTIELENSGIKFRRPDHKYTLKQFLVQEWKDVANPWSPFLCAVFGTTPEGRAPTPPGKNSSKFLLFVPVKLLDCDSEIHDSIYED